jgi:hypothetical protein
MLTDSIQPLFRLYCEISDLCFFGLTSLLRCSVHTKNLAVIFHSQINSTLYTTLIVSVCFNLMFILLHVFIFNYAVLYIPGKIGNIIHPRYLSGGKFYPTCD